jgi:hypothetical protein
MIAAPEGTLVMVVGFEIESRYIASRSVGIRWENK